MARTVHAARSTALALALAGALAGCGPIVDGGTDAGGGTASCPTDLGVAVEVTGTGASRQIKATFQADGFITRWDWIRLPDHLLASKCWKYDQDAVVKRVVIGGADPVAGKVATGYVTYDTLPVPPADVTYWWKSSTGVEAKHVAGSEDLYKADPGPALTAGTYEVVFAVFSLPALREVGRARFAW